MNATDKYLRRFAENEVQFIDSARFTRRYRNVLVIPAYDEQPGFIERLRQHPKISSCLVVLVVNRPDDSSNNQRNRHLYQTLEKNSRLHWSQDNTRLGRLDKLDILLIDRFWQGPPIPRKQGVGLARKIGTDIACALIHAGIVERSWIYTSDADAHWPINYFDENLPGEASAACFDFRHVDDGSIAAHATLLYERAIKYYRDALRWAGSPYAFCALGSSMAINMDSYCQVRGFPKRAAGEDFYLLNKLAKIAPVKECHDVVLTLESRLSVRTPFGTGAAAGSIVRQQAAEQEYRYYHPQIFAFLRQWLTCVNTQLADHPDSLYSDSKGLAPLADPIRKAATLLKFDKFMEHTRRQCKDSKAFMLHFHMWFDGFRTLRFVHILQEHALPPVPLDQAIEQANQIFSSNTIKDNSLYFV